LHNKVASLTTCSGRGCHGISLPAH
jgi:hypothetical protein